eukprot:1161956-Pelagomonas_calceolata.AAC.9
MEMPCVFKVPCYFKMRTCFVTLATELTLYFDNCDRKRHKPMLLEGHQSAKRPGAGALSKLQANTPAVEDYVFKIQFLLEASGNFSCLSRPIVAVSASHLVAHVQKNSTNEGLKDLSFMHPCVDALMHAALVNGEMSLQAGPRHSAPARRPTHPHLRNKNIVQHKFSM